MDPLANIVLIFVLLVKYCQCIDSIQIIENIPKERILNEEWFKNLISERKPVLIRQSINSEWDAFTKWTQQYITETLPILDNVIMHNSSNFLFTNTMGSPLAEYAINPYERHTLNNLSTASFFAIGLNESIDNKIFPSYSGHIIERSEQLQSEINDYDELSALFERVTNNNAHNTYLWLSFNRFMTRFHYDVDPNIYFQSVCVCVCILSSLFQTDCI